MDFSLTDEQQLLLDSVRELMERGNYDNYFKECDAKGELPQKAIDAAVEAGFATLGIPEEFGGSGYSYVELIVVLTLMRSLLVAAKVVPPSCARCGVQLERRALGEPVCRCGS